MTQQRVRAAPLAPVQFSVLRLARGLVIRGLDHRVRAELRLLLLVSSKVFRRSGVHESLAMARCVAPVAGLLCGVQDRAHGRRQFAVRGISVRLCTDCDCAQ